MAGCRFGARIGGAGSTEVAHSWLQPSVGRSASRLSLKGCVVAASAASAPLTSPATAGSLAIVGGVAGRATLRLSAGLLILPHPCLLLLLGIAPTASLPAFPLPPF